MTDTDTREPRDEAELLLPWYVTGKLTDEERRQVESWLEAHPEERRQLELIEEDRHGSISGNEALPVPSRASFDRLMAEVEADGRAAPASPSLLARIGAWFETVSPSMRGAMVGAALALVVAQTAAIGILMSGDGDGNGFQTASQPAGETADGVHVLVSFAPDAPAGEIAGLLASAGGRIVDGPRAGGIYTVEFAEDTDPREAARDLAERDDLVSFAAPGS